MQFLTPNRIIFGRGTINKLSKSVTGKTIIISGEHVWNFLEEKINLDAPIIIFERDTPDSEPVEKDIEKLADKIKDHKPDTIVAIGGGSVIDAAKIARIIYEQCISWDFLYSGKISSMNSKFIAIETTSGTGTGVSAAAVVKDKNDFKAGIVSPYIIPDIAIYDPDITQSMPRKVAIYTGMDALTHAIEAYTSNVENVISNTLALKAIELIYQNLKASVNGDPKARDYVHYGNMLAGIGFTNSRLGLCHSAAHWIGGKYNIPHGKINAILLPYVIKVNENSTKKFEDISKIMGVKDVAKAIIDMNRFFGLPTHINIKEKDLEFLSEKISQDRLMNFNPRQMNAYEVLRFLKAAQEGNLNEI